MKLIIATTVATTLALTPLLAADNEPAKRLDEAAAVLSEIMAAPDKGIPQELIEKAHCIVIVPDLKTAAFVFRPAHGVTLNLHYIGSALGFHALERGP